MRRGTNCKPKGVEPYPIGTKVRVTTKRWGDAQEGLILTVTEYRPDGIGLEYSCKGFPQDNPNTTNIFYREDGAYYNVYNHYDLSPVNVKKLPEDLDEAFL